MMASNKPNTAKANNRVVHSKIRSKILLLESKDDFCRGIMATVVLTANIVLQVREAETRCPYLQKTSEGKFIFPLK